jgi:hypothetical protein
VNSTRIERTVYCCVEFKTRNCRELSQNAYTTKSRISFSASIPSNEDMSQAGRKAIKASSVSRT